MGRKIYLTFCFKVFISRPMKKFNSLSAGSPWEGYLKLTWSVDTNRIVECDISSNGISAITPISEYFTVPNYMGD